MREGVPVVVVVSLRRQRAVTVVHLQGTHAHPALLAPETRPDRGSYVLFLGHQLIGLNAPLHSGPPSTPTTGSDRTIHSTSIHPQFVSLYPHYPLLIIPLWSIFNWNSFGSTFLSFFFDSLRFLLAASTVVNSRMLNTGFIQYVRRAMNRTCPCWQKQLANSLLLT